MKNSFTNLIQKSMPLRTHVIMSSFIFLIIMTFASVASSNDDIGKELFLKGAAPACAVCHTLKAAGAVGEVGPSMNELQPNAARVMNAVKNGIGIMPAYANLTPEQLQILAEYVAKASLQ
jgi:cytochrome c6